MGLGDLATGLVDAYKGNQSSSNLQGFLSKFNSSGGLYSNTIDPLNTFDIRFKFFPGKKDEKKKDGWEAVGDKFLSMGKQAVGNLANNLTGGIAASLSQTEITKLQEQYISDGIGVITFIEYLARAHQLAGEPGLMGGNSDTITSPNLQIDFSYYVQDIQLPQITLKEEGTVETMVGEFPVNGRYVKPSSNQFTMNMINTKATLPERIFYPWMKEVTSPFWAYDEQPYTTANVTVDYSKHADMQYVFVNARPSNIEALRATNDLQSPIRSVTMIFDYMFVTSKLKLVDDWKSKLMGVATGALGGAGNMIGL